MKRTIVFAAIVSLAASAAVNSGEAEAEDDAKGKKVKTRHSLLGKKSRGKLFRFHLSIRAKWLLHSTEIG